MFFKKARESKGFWEAGRIRSPGNLFLHLDNNYIGRTCLMYFGNSGLNLKGEPGQKVVVNGRQLCTCSWSRLPVAFGSQTEQKPTLSSKYWLCMFWSPIAASDLRGEKEKKRRASTVVAPPPQQMWLLGELNAVDHHLHFLFFPFGSQTLKARTCTCNYTCSKS